MDLKEFVLRITRELGLLSVRGVDRRDHTAPIAFKCGTPGCRCYQTMIRVDFVVPGTENVIIAGYKSDPMTPMCPRCLRPCVPDPKKVLERLALEEIQKQQKANDEE